MVHAVYGHVSPKTPLGQLVTIIYAIFGIPLTLLTITKLGGFMATVFRFIYRDVCCTLCCICCRRRRLPPPPVGDLETGYGNKNPAVSEGGPEENSDTSWSMIRKINTEDVHEVQVGIILLISAVCIFYFVLADRTARSVMG